MLLETLTGASLVSAGVLAYGVRGRSACLFGPSVWKGPATRRALALTFDDGPSESTPALLDLLRAHGAKATFFQCGHHVRRLPDIAKLCVEQGHEPGNHSDTHPALFFRSPAFIYDQLERTQTIITETTGVRPTLFRPPFGARWFGLRSAQDRLRLLNVMWTFIARDWKLPAQGIVDYLTPRVHNGAILCFHDGRELVHRPDISSTLGALEILLPKWVSEGFELTTVTDLLGLPPTAPTAP
jgi:peptidoglycan/xylan/chitin deacetylase (PgdA/CDA1 family)